MVISGGRHVRCFGGHRRFHAEEELDRLAEVGGFGHGQHLDGLRVDVELG